MFTSAEDIETSLTAAGFAGRDRDQLVDLARPLVWLRTREAARGDVQQLASTRIGGDPDLPAGLEWPRRPAYPDAGKRKSLYDQQAGMSRTMSWATAAQRAAIREEAMAMAAIVARPLPLAFIAQINLADVWSAGPIDPDIPRAGLLSIFYDTIEQPWGFQVSDLVGARVVFTPDLGSPGFERRAVPDELKSAVRFEPIKRLRCDLRAAVAPVPWELATFTRLGLSDEKVSVYRDWMQEKSEASSDGEDWGCHRVSGWPTPVQGDMQTQAALISRGYYLGDGDGYRRGKANGDDRDAADWVLIAQIGSDGKGGYMWGDVGQIYLWIRRDDLKARRFDKALLFQQSY